MSHKFNKPEMPDYGDPQHMADRAIALFGKADIEQGKHRVKGHIITALAACGFAGWIVAEQIDAVMVCINGEKT